ncbi:hypothetical protein [Flagellimonas allohymeniacidonis]|uniref:Uncharacterized protein n=1 Tax=Flagellimonas allohymeniacidonis TaxID=2517819 RepID=A0A4Q8QI01_9FLAO|nr:hypothetical protein [Allomuricauda hymeniacidonis]TAI49437.1 hypothetical protein EW142_06455 [Allomuricauda hymeniacidonis]
MRSRKTVLVIIFILGLIGLWLLSSAGLPNACEYANSNLEYIKKQTESAITSEDFELSKYYAYKAINSIEKTRSNFEDCGCYEAIESLDHTLTSLIEATRAESLKSSKKSLNKALENTMIGITELKLYGPGPSISGQYRDDMLVMNTKEVLDSQGGIINPKKVDMKQEVHNTLIKFETSIANIVSSVDCAEAKRFIQATFDNANVALLNTELTVRKKIYHQRVKTITKRALLELSDCQ